MICHLIGSILQLVSTKRRILHLLMIYGLSVSWKNLGSMKRMTSNKMEDFKPLLQDPRRQRKGSLEIPKERNIKVWLFDPDLEFDENVKASFQLFKFSQ